MVRCRQPQNAKSHRGANVTMPYHESAMPHHAMPPEQWLLKVHLHLHGKAARHRNPLRRHLHGVAPGTADLWWGMVHMHTFRAAMSCFIASSSSDSSSSPFPARGFH